MKMHMHPQVEKFLDVLEKPTHAKVWKLIALIIQRGIDLGMPFSRYIENDIYELRIVGIQNVRILYTFFRGEIFLLHGFAKKTQKLNRTDIETAQVRLALLRNI